MSPALRRILHWAGSGFAIIGIAFVAIRLNEYWGNQDLLDITPTAWMTIAGLAVLYGSANILLALAWRQLLGQFTVCVTRLWSIKVYGISQLAKYVPGNIFHLAGRQAIGMSAGISGGVLAKSTLWELGLVAVAGILHVWLFLPILAPGLSSLASITLFLGTVWVVGYFLRWFFGLRVSVSFGLQMLFLAVSGGIFVILLETIVRSGVHHPQTWLVIGGSYVVAWLVGLVTPGAPAGVGVRELVLLFLLEGLVTDADLIMAVLLGRMVTVVGDLLFFSASFFISVKKVLLEENHG
ncbi:MAG: hypothetical protein BECKG1743D_GA0114223_107352 [Candidatus Kentron sp. G]|nr:MAG: hypothetical protein BECKG1743F_GA0114225_104414 [Candidatus Kentron sp. G]VFN02295.1 MAG: hypothetical protein BECKG1743E_GA0114224_104913 [Candidatus Kentron sp. G]VFN05551.1 MAG: hypothetical protein BECKG1743D_GA0114223_107352 [Candidatus Kentron sp. G]